MAALVGLLLTAAAIGLAWLLYRLERLHARHRDLDGALAVLRGVKRGMIERVGDDVGWAENYFSTIYTGAGDDREVRKRVDEAEAVIKDRWAMQVFPVPLAPLELLVSSPATAGLVSDETVFIANFGLWRVGVFNEFVRLQADFNARLAVEIRDPHTDPARRDAIARAAAWIAHQIHVYGINGANLPGGWYTRLKDALDADIARLTEERARGFFDYRDSRKWFLLGDLGMAALVTAFTVTVLVAAICS
jgi:hypothetical protein